MKVLMLNGSPRVNGNTAVALREMEAVFAREGIETETVQVGQRDIRGCIACGKCGQLGKCVFDDIVNELAPKFQAADGLVVASPVYYASANPTLVALLDRLFYSTGFDKTILALSVSRIPGMARTLRASVMQTRNEEYVEAAGVIGCGTFRTIVKYVLPNSFAPLLVSATMGIANTILTTASLSYIGLGIQPPTPEWGAMLSAAKKFIRDYPYMLIFPGLFIAITVLSLNMLGDGLRDALDPKLKD